MREEEEARIKLENSRRRSVLRREAEKIVRFIPGQSVESLVEVMDNIGYSSSRDFEPAIERGVVAVRSLKEVAKAAEDLKESIEKLGVGALMMLARSNAAESLRMEADSHDLPQDGDAPTDSTIEALIMLRRGGKWVVRLEALAELARHEAENVQKMIRKGGSGVFQLHLAETEQSLMIQFCINRLRSWGAETKYAPRMARAIRAARTGGAVGPGWGNAMYRKLLRTLPG